MASREQLEAEQVAQALLGSVSGLELPPQVVMPPQAAIPQVPVAAVPPQVETRPPAANPQVPIAANPRVPVAANPRVPAAPVLEEKHDPVVPAPVAPAPQDAVPNAQSNPPVTPHHRLMLRLVRALPIASNTQLQAMLDVFNPRVTPPPAAQNSNPSPQQRSFPPPNHAGCLPPYRPPTCLPRRNTARTRPIERSATTPPCAALTKKVRPPPQQFTPSPSSYLY